MAVKNDIYRIPSSRPVSGLFRVLFKRAYFLVLLMALYGAAASGQEMLGVMNGNYAGVNGLVMNPSFPAGSVDFLSINLVGADIYANSNYLFIHRKDYSFGGLFTVDINDPAYLYTYYYPSVQFTDTLHYLDYLKKTSLKRVFVNTRVLGPSLMYRNGIHTFSLVSGFRNNVSVDKMTYNTANFIFRGLDFVPQQDITYSEGPYQVALLSWIELGLGYSCVVYEDDQKAFTAGITGKVLLGMAGAYGSVKDVTYNVPNNDTILFDKLDCTMGFALPIDLSGGTELQTDPLIRGWGVGFDVGVSYVRKGGSSSRNALNADVVQDVAADYRYRVGLSLLDLGKITFNQGVEVHEFSGVTNEMWSGLRGFHARSIRNFLNSASYNLLGDSTASLTDKSSFGIWLPAAVSLQADYNFGYHLFANLTFVQGISFGTPSVRRSTLLALTPRYETRWYEVNLPLSLVDFRDPQIGLALRIFGLTVGTEKLGTFLHLSDVRGVDLYFALSFPIGPGKNNWKGPRSKSGPCDSYENYERYRVRGKYR
ncbi:MAG: hypothetical protein EOM90_03170 [Alphaproteobacteria bacterium]|nr:hypothetical protein [Alphaproteobacteria bacterium]